MKFILNIQYKTLCLLLSLLIISCSKEDPEPINEEELITTVQLTFKTPGITDQIVRWQEGFNNSDIISLAANTQYEVEIIFLDESDPSDIEDITEEVKEEADEHQIFYQFSQLNISLEQSSSDTLDSNQNPLFVNSLPELISKTECLLVLVEILQSLSKVTIEVGTENSESVYRALLVILKS